MTMSMSPATADEESERSFIGKHIRRIDSEKKIDGSVDYTDDLPYEGYYAHLVRSNVTHGTITDVDTEAAEAVPGVEAVVTGKDLDDADWISPYVGPAYRDQPLLAVDRVRYIGDPVVAVIAESTDAAERAADLVSVDYDRLPAASSIDEAQAEDAPLLHDHEEVSAVFDDLKSVKVGDIPNVAYNYTYETGDVEAAFAEADHVVEGTYSTPMIQHAHLEPFVTVADYEAETNTLRVVTGNQTPHFVQQEIARILDLPSSAVEIEIPQMGGSYGAKTYVRLEPLTAALSRWVEAPVKLRQTSSESFDTAVRDGTETTVKTGVTEDGEVVAQRVDVDWDTGAYADIGPRKAKKAGYTATGPYDVPNVSISSRSTYTNKPPAVAYRGFGVSQTAWAVESNMDDVAAEIDVDPYELRTKNLVQNNGTYNGSPIGEHGVPECLDAVVEDVDWLETAPEQPEADHLVAGRGVAATLKATITPSNAEAIAMLNTDGSVTVITGSTKVGQGVQTTLAQIAATEFGVDVDRVNVPLPNTNMAPFNTSTTSSRTTYHVGNAIVRAVEEIKEQLREFAAEEWGLDDPSAVEIRNGTVTGPAGQQFTLSELVTEHFVGGGGTVIGRGYYSTEAGADESYASAFWMSGASVVDVTVDVRTGKYRLDRWVNATDAGTAIDPERVRGQILGAATTGLGHVRSEEMVFEGGQQVNKSLLDYKVPAMEDVPDESSTIIVETNDSGGPHGAKGVGEANTTTVPPAVANAIFDATGARVRSLPVTPEKVLHEITENGGDNA
jgi:CO/xanthine dehydrogenase Mo-binding subunit